MWWLRGCTDRISPQEWILSKTLQTSHKVANKAPHSQNIISQDNQLPLGNTFWPEISVTWFQQRAEFTPCPRDRAQPTRWVSTIKSLPHCSTHYHFTGFTFPKLHFQLFPILKHSSLVSSPRSPSSTKWVHIAEEKKKKELQTYIIWNVKVTLCINEELHQCWEVLQYRQVCCWSILLYKKRTCA